MKRTLIDDSLWFIHKDGGRFYPWLRYSKHHRLRSFWVRFEDLAGNLEALEPLVGALGKSIGPAQRSVLEMPEGRGGVFGDRSVHARWKAISFPQLIAARLIAGELNDRLGHPSPGWAANVPLRRRVA